MPTATKSHSKDPNPQPQTPASLGIDGADLMLGLSPAIAAASLYQSNTHSLGILYENAVAIQKQQTQIAQTSLKAGVELMQHLSAEVAKTAVKAEDPDGDVLALLEKIKELV